MPDDGLAPPVAVMLPFPVIIFAISQILPPEPPDRAQLLSPVVEVAPPFDNADITAILANRVVLEALSAIAKRRSGTPYSPTQNLLDR